MSLETDNVKATIIGFAVTSKTEKDHFIAGYAVREIGNYDREALVVVAVGEKSAISKCLTYLQLRHFPFHLI